MPQIKDDWTTYDNFFKKEEVAVNIALMKMPDIDTVRVNRKTNFIEAAYKYLRSDNIYTMLLLGK